MKSFRAISRLSVELQSNVSEAISDSIIRTYTLMMDTETVFETLDCNSRHTRLMAREDFIAFSRRENFRLYLYKFYYNGDIILQES
jgi:hypothetical protein